MDAPRLHIDVDGAGPVVLLAHGFGGSARNFGPQMRALKDRYRVVRYDARGHGRSDAPTEASAYTPAAFVDDMRRVLDEVGATAAVVGGLSMGAGIALRFALAHPSRVRGLVLSAFPAGADDPDGFAGKALAFADRIERDGLEAAGHDYVWGPSTRLDPNAVNFVRQGFLEHPAHGLELALRGVIARQPSVAAMRADLAHVRMPVLIVVGSEDGPSLRASRALAGAIPHAKLVVVPDAGHVVNLQKPDEVSAAIHAFVDGL
jgi:2-succinyl-6-hydroxy-2,4-cyclohexadiene-1-carboxylate synthase